jgi:hypothetical protein
MAACEARSDSGPHKKRKGEMPKASRQAILRYNQQHNIRNDVKNKYSYLEKCHAGIMNCIERFYRDLVPPAVHTIDPIMCKYKEQKPPYQKPHINDGTPS